MRRRSLAPSRPRVLALFGASLLSLGVSPAVHAQSIAVDSARSALLGGEYLPAIAVLRGVPRGDSEWMDAQRLLTGALHTTGKYDEAERVARAASTQPGGAELLTTLGAVLRDRGRLADAESAWVRAGREQASDSLTALVNIGVLWVNRGDRDGARRIFDHFIDVYNGRRAELTSDDLAAVALACRYLGDDNPQLFKDALKAYDAAIALNPANLGARTALGELFAAKYNGADAKSTLDAVLEINPRHPRALVAAAARADADNAPGVDSLIARALAVDPEYVPARLMRARSLLDLERYDDAQREVERALRVNPASREAVAVAAAIAFVKGNTREYDRQRDRARALNATDGAFYATVSEAAARVRRYAVAADFARQGIEADPRYWPAYSRLGLNLLRRGDIAGGKRMLDTAFAGDPYDVRVKNTLDLLDTFGNYDTTGTAHATVMIEREESPLLSVYVGALVDSAFTVFSRRYQYVPPERLRIEVYRSHADFSVRTVGLAGLAASGVSFGTTLAFDSPAAADIGAFNWGSTVWHEVAHTFTLGLTDNRVPRWLSEGLSVFEEHRARAGWGMNPSLGWLEAYRQGRMVPPSRMNDGFMRPAYPQQVPYSYLQAALVCEFIAEQWGEPALVRMLREYRSGRTTEQVFGSVLGTDLRSFDERFDARVRQAFGVTLVALAEPVPDGIERLTPDELVTVSRAKRESLRVQFATGVLLARAGRTEDAIAALERARVLFPASGDTDGPLPLLAQLYEQRGDLAKAVDARRTQVTHNESDLEGHVDLVRLALAAHDTTTAIDALDRTMFINPMDLDRHKLLASLAAARGQWALAVRERRALVAMAPVDLAGAWYDLAWAQYRGGDAPAAKRAVLRALEEAPNYRAAQELLLLIVEGKP